MIFENPIAYEIEQMIILCGGDEDDISGEALAKDWKHRGLGMDNRKRRSRFGAGQEGIEFAVNTGKELRRVLDGKKGNISVIWALGHEGFDACAKGA